VKSVGVIETATVPSSRIDIATLSTHIRRSLGIPQSQDLRRWYQVSRRCTDGIAGASGQPVLSR
jgi:hypothetical protein